MENLYGMFFGNFWFYGFCIYMAGTLAYFGLPLLFWSALTAFFFFGIGVSTPVWILFGAYFSLFNIKFVRTLAVSTIVMKIIQALKILPKISETERVALQAGKVWIEREYFSGKPNFNRMMNEPYPSLTKEEQDFINGSCDELCKMMDDWKAWNEDDLSAEVWTKLKKDGYLGMIIPKKYGGRGFSALAHSAVIKKLSSRSVPLAVTAMVPNSLGPAELLIHYGTEEQKNYYLPRLANGEEIPCFALTEPHAGSDAGSIQSFGIVFKKDGKLWIRLTWNKRYITLAAISTVLGLAFKLRDPENLLGKGEDLGITCALVPSNTPGVVLGKRHNPLGCPFYNCPTEGNNVEVPIDVVVGGVNGCGNGWKMLMECLAAGRGISLPAQTTGGSCVATTYVSAYSAIRKQFGMNIGKFEGIMEPMSRIAGYTYMMEASRIYTLGALDSGIQPPVITAIMKYNITEFGRKLVTDAMDIVGGAGISRGPRNILGHFWTATPIGITVEGANILTRTLIIFGQGLMRAHPTVFNEVDSIEKGDASKFDDAFWSHIGLVVQNIVRACWLSLTRGRFVIPYRFDSTYRYYQKLTWASATFAVMSDIAMGTMGGKLKTSEMLTGRFADILSNLYLGTSVLRRYEAEGRPKEQKPFVHWCMQTLLYQTQTAFNGIFTNFHVPIPVIGTPLGWLFRGPLKTWCNLNALHHENNDINNQKIATIIQKPGKIRDMFKEGIYMPAASEKHETLRILEDAFVAHWESVAIQKKIRNAIKDKKIPKKSPPKVAFDNKIITKEEFESLEKAERLRDEAVQVDSFPLKFTPVVKTLEPKGGTNEVYTRVSR